MSIIPELYRVCSILFLRTKAICVMGVILELASWNLAHQHTHAWWISSLPVAYMSFSILRSLTEPHFVSRVLSRSVTRTTFIVSVLIVSLTPSLLLVIRQFFIEGESFYTLAQHLGDYVIFWSLTFAFFLLHKTVMAAAMIAYPGVTSIPLLSIHFSSLDISLWTHAYISIITTTLALSVSCYLFIQKDLHP